MIKKRVYYLLLCIGLLYVKSSTLYAQNNTLEQCLTDQAKAIQALLKNRSSTQRALFQPIGATTHQQIHYDWGECVKGHRMPLSSFTTLNGESYDSSSLAGKVLVLNFWFMGCVPCVEEMPALNKLVEAYKGKDVLFLGFSSDKADQLKTAFFQKHPFSFKIIADARDIGKSFYFYGNPATYIVDQQGIIRNAWVGGIEFSALEPYNRAKAAIDTILATAPK